MRLPLKEPRSPNYIYINPKTNVVHLLMPIMTGTDIGLDNTCKSVYALQEFFGLLGANKQRSAIGSLEAYRANLIFDLKYVSDVKIKEKKTARLTQIDNYIKLLKQIQSQSQITTPLMQGFPTYPKPLESLMQDRSSNLYSMVLCPAEKDSYLRMGAIPSVFSLNRDGNSKLYRALSIAYQNMIFPEERLVKKILTSLPNQSIGFEELRTRLQHQVQADLNITCTFEEIAATNDAPSVAVDQAYLNTQLSIDPQDPDANSAYLRALIFYCEPKLFENALIPPFEQCTTVSQLNITTQLLMAELNFFCMIEGLTQANFGSILDSDETLSIELAQVVKTALAKNHSVEESVIGWMNQHQATFKLNQPITAIAQIKTQFKSHYEQIKSSPHFDEFMLLSDKPGIFFTHQGCIGVHFAWFLQAMGLNSDLTVWL